jgi:hypothetical protein
MYIKFRGKVHSITDQEDPEGAYMYSFNLTLASALGRWSTPRPGRFAQGNDPVTTVYESVWDPGPVWTGEENFAPPGFDPRTVQPVASLSTDWAIPAHIYMYIHEILAIIRKKLIIFRNNYNRMLLIM